MPAELLGVLREVPLLDGAACSGRGPMWDGGSLPGEDDQARDVRHQRAAEVCQQCPALMACEELASRYSGRALTGVWAGRLRPLRGRRAAS